MMFESFLLVHCQASIHQASIHLANPQASLLNRLRTLSIDVESGGADSAWKAVTAYRRMAAFLRSSPPDLCQTFMYHANVLGTLAASRNTNAVRVGGLRVAEKRGLRCRVESRAVAAMDSLVCVSDGVADFAQEKLACPKPKCTVIPNTVDCVRFGVPCLEPSLWDDLGWPDDTELILFIGRMHPQKGIDLLQMQIERLAPAGSKRRLLMIGDGPLSNSLDDWCAEVGVDRVRRMSFQSDVRPWIQMSRVLVLPSRYEGMPNVVLEAMASQRPVVVARVEGVRELLPSANQQLFEIGDHESMAQRVDSLMADANLRERLGEENRERVACDFSIPTMIDSYRSLYRGLIQRS